MSQGCTNCDKPVPLFGQRLEAMQKAKIYAKEIENTAAIYQDESGFGYTSFQNAIERGFIIVEAINP